MRILIVEDETELGKILQEYLRAESFDALVIADGTEALNRILHEHWDLILLDVMLPGTDGLTICQEVRKVSHVPIILMTAKVEEIDRLLGLELGADDYICKPYSPREVVARVKAVLRRASSETITTHFHLNQNDLSAHLHDKSVEITLVEFRLLETLLTNHGRVISRDQLKKSAYTDHRIVSDRTMDSHINKLRKKLSPLTTDDIIYSVYGAGYKLQIPQKS